MKKPSKKEEVKNEEPLSITGSFADLINVSVSGNPTPKPKEKKGGKK